jgi:hypothetical protein
MTRGRCAALAIAIPIAGLAACAPAADESAVAPLTPAAAPDTASGDGPAATPTAPPTTGAPPETPRATTTAEDPVAAPSDELRSQVDRVLERYARALTDLAQDPERLTREGTAERAAWDRTVLSGSVLSEDLISALVRRQREDGMVVRPGPGGLSYRHRPLLVEPPQEGTISFTWCGWSPGIGVDVHDRSVRDDAVAHSHGVGQLRLVGGHWMLEQLDELDRTALPPDSPDPCPAEVATLAGIEQQGGPR